MEDKHQQQSREADASGEASLPSESSVPRKAYAVLARLAANINGSADVKAICDMAVSSAAGLYGADAGSVFLSTKSRYLQHTSGFGLSSRFISSVEELARSQSSARFINSLLEPALVSDIGNYTVPAPYRQLLDDEGIVSVASLPLINLGKLLGFVTLYHGGVHNYSRDDYDLLELLANLLALAVANAQFVEAKEGEDQARDRFLSALSHELRTPLTSILGFTQIIRKRLSAASPPDARLLDQLEVLWSQAQRLNRLVDTFVDLSNIERGEFAINLGKVDLAAVVQAAVAQAQGQARTSQQVTVQCFQPSVWVHGDARRLGHVFTHIVSNALRYSPPGKPVEVTCSEQQQGWVVVEIMDRGSGIAPQLHKEIFERTNPSFAQRTGGLGVGLYLSKIFIEAHGGHISIRSNSAEGTKVTVELPV